MPRDTHIHIVLRPFRTATSLQRIKSKETPTNPVRSLNSTIAETW